MKKIFIGDDHGCDLNYTYSILKAQLSSCGEIVDDVSEADYIVFPATCAGTLGIMQVVMGYMLKTISQKKEGALTFVTGCMTRKITNPKVAAIVSKFLNENFDYVIAEDDYHEIINIISQDNVLEPNFGACLAYQNEVSVYISRGCNNKCSFCKMQYQDLPTRSVDFEDIKHLIMNFPSKIDTVSIYGTNISQYGIDKDYEHNLCDILFLLKETPQVENVDLFGFAFRDAIKNNFAKNLRDNSKIRRIKGSIETGSPRLLSMMGKGYTIPELIEFLDEIQDKYPRVLDTDVIVGFPTETYEDIDLTLQLLDRLNPERVQLHMYQNSYLVPSSRFEQLSNEEVKEHYKVYKRELKGMVNIVQ